MPADLQQLLNSLPLAVQQDPRLAPFVWSREVKSAAATADVFSKMTGKPGSGMPFIEDRSLTSFQGNKVVMTVDAPLNKTGVIGGGLLKGSEEIIRGRTFSCRIDFWRNAVAADKQARNYTEIYGNFDNRARPKLADWAGRKKQRDMKMKLILAADPNRNPTGNGASSDPILGAPGTNIFRPNFKTSKEAVKSADTINYALIEASAMLCNTNGGAAANLIKNPASKKIDNELRRYLFFGTDTGLYSLKLDGRYNNVLLQASAREGSNPLRDGGYVTVQGSAIYEHEIIDPPFGPIGDPQNARARLGVAIAAYTNGTSGSTNKVYGGTLEDGATPDTTEYQPFIDFSNFAYYFTSFDAPITSSATRYAVGYNLTGANAGKFFAFSYQVNDGYTLTILNRLGPVASADGFQATTVGNMAYTGNASGPGTSAGNPFNGIMCDALSVNAAIFETNSYGVPTGYSFVLGEAAALRCYGRDDMSRTEDMTDYKFRQGVGIELEYGQTPCVDAAGRIPNYALIEHAIAPVGIPFPTIV